MSEKVCPNCGGRIEAMLKEYYFEQENKSVVTEAFVCVRCGFDYMSNEQMDNMRKLVQEGNKDKP